MGERHDVAWLECLKCGGAYAIMRHPHALPHDGQAISLMQFIGMDGQDVTEEDMMRCITCGAPYQFTPTTVLLRIGDRLPARIDTPVMEDFYSALKRQRGRG